MQKLLYKICIVGDGGVGKTTILNRYIQGIFLEETKMTVGTNFFIKDIDLPHYNASIKLQIWDLGGQSHFAAIRQNFYSGAKGVIYVFDYSRRYTFNNLIDWRDEVRPVISESVPSILIGNKIDLISEDNSNISLLEISIMQQELKVFNFLRTSAKTNIGIKKVFYQLAENIYKKYHQKKYPYSKDHTSQI